MAFNLKNMFEGLAGNLSIQDLEKANQQYGKFLIEGEQIQEAFTLIRDAVVFTNIRIIIVDKQGATGKKTAIKSIYLMNIVDCSMETAGAGIDDSEITLTYLTSINRLAHNEQLATYKMEFPKKMEIEPLYRKLFTLGYNNRLELNKAN
ncbi:PH domain-containing protein [Cellulosilyticum sp. I15G10I2]|uniref:PH domain-containing protein n=1 Tax=Cellulosilyticum sp. I15G10I2 TaxID=1892843 RepID=UPI00085CAB7D|nr:PH domain-containing protein [Cellulosilyticum sp. I15G10I2]